MTIDPSVLVLYRESQSQKELRWGSGEGPKHGPEPYSTMDKKKPLREAPPRSIYRPQHFSENLLIERFCYGIPTPHPSLLNSGYNSQSAVSL